MTRLALVLSAALAAVGALAPSAARGQTILMDGMGDWTAEGYCGGGGSRNFVQGPKLETALAGIVDFDSRSNGYVAAGTFVALVTPDGQALLLTGQPGIGGNTDGLPGAATFGHALDLAVVNDNLIYVVDSANLTLRKLERKDGVWHTSTAVGSPGVRGHRDGPGQQALLTPVFDSVTADPATGIVYLFDGDWIRKFENGVVTTLNPQGGGGYTNGPLAGARFAHSQGRAHGLTCDGKGNLYVADKVNAAIRRIDLVKGEVSTIAGRRPEDARDAARDAVDALNGRFCPGGGPNMIFYNAKLDALICRSDDENSVRIIQGGSLKTFGPGPGPAVPGKWKGSAGGLPCGVDREGRVYLWAGDSIRRLSQGGSK